MQAVTANNFAELLAVRLASNTNLSRATAKLLFQSETALRHGQEDQTPKARMDSTCRAAA